MDKKYALKLIMLPFFTCIIIASLIYGDYHTVSNSEVEQSVKTFLDNKYGQEFTVKVVKYNEGISNESGFGEDSSYFNVEAKSNGKTYDIVYAKEIRSLNLKEMNFFKDTKYPNSLEIIKENIEGRDWNKEVSYYYSKVISKYCDDGYLKEVDFLVDRAPSRIGMSAEEYINELFDYYVPDITIKYAVFVDDVYNARHNDEVLKKIDDVIRRKADINRRPDRYFSEQFLIVSKKDKDEYIKKVNEYNKINSDYFGSSSYDRYDDKKRNEYWENIKPVGDWLKKTEQNACFFEYDIFGGEELKQTWRKNQSDATTQLYP